MSTLNQKTVLIDNLVTTTFYGQRTEIIDQVVKKTPFYDKLAEGGGVKEKAPDGTHWEYPIRYANQDQNRKWFGRGDTFGSAEKEHLTNLIFQIRNVGTNVVRFWDDDQKNRGKAKLIDYATEVVESSKTAMMEGFADDMLVQNSDPLSMSALPTLISETPTVGTIGGLSRSANAYLQNQIKDFSGLSTGTNLLKEMQRMVNLCSQWKGKGRQTPNLILTSRKVYQDYENICIALQTIQTNKTERASLGFGDLLYKNIEMFWDPRQTDDSMYFLNTDTFEMPYDPSCWFEMTPWKTPPSSLDRMAQIVCRCNLLCTSPQKNGVIFKITPTTA